MTPRELKDSLLQAFSEEIIEIDGKEDEPQLVLKKEGLYNVVEHLKSRGYDYLSFITAVDNQKDLSVLYRLASPPGTNAINIKVSLPKANLKIDSLATLFHGANWLEREVFDLFGIKFEDHPDLRRILLPEDWEGYPLRKTYSHPEIEKRPRMF